MAMAIRPIQTGVRTSAMTAGTQVGATAAGAAVLGVVDGPVTITYRDSNDSNRSFVIQIDIEPPTINIESPVHKSRSDDEKPSFVGTINDGDAGLAAGSFQLYVDNDPVVGNFNRKSWTSQRRTIVAAESECRSNRATVWNMR